MMRALHVEAMRQRTTEAGRFRTMLNDNVQVQVNASESKGSQ